jgi:hypothetical protein
MGSRMNIQSVLDELAAALESISGLRVYTWVPGTVSPPTAIVGLPDAATFDVTYQRGMDRLTIPIVLAVGKPVDRSATAAMSDYLSGSGAKSIKAAIDAGTYTACDFANVQSASVDVVTFGSTDYLAAVFQVDVAGSGD